MTSQCQHCYDRHPSRAVTILNPISNLSYLLFKIFPKKIRINYPENRIVDPFYSTDTKSYANERYALINGYNNILNKLGRCFNFF